MDQSETDKRLILLLRISAFLCFAGWFWVHYYWEAPYIDLLWNESTFSLAEKLGITWETFVGTGANDGVIQIWMGRTYWLYVICAVVSLTALRGSRVQLAILTGGSFLLLIVAFTKFIQSYGQFPMLIEYGGQILAPTLLVSGLTLGVRHRFTIFIAITAVITTFAGHGVYALGWWPTPSSFFGMTSVILDLEHPNVVRVLHVAGMLDLAICIGIFIPFLRSTSVLYAALWGLLTAAARPISGMSMSLNFWGADQYLHEFILRAPHFLIPLFLFLLWHRAPQRTEQALAGGWLSRIYKAMITKTFPNSHS